MQRYYSVVYYSKFDLYFYRLKTYQKESKIILFFSQNYIFLSDERPDSLIFENVLGESSPPARCPIPDGGQVRIQPVSPVNLQVLGQVVRPGKTLLTNSASGKNWRYFIILNFNRVYSLYFLSFSICNAAIFYFKFTLLLIFLILQDD